MSEKLQISESVKSYFATTEDFAGAMKNDDKIFLYARGSEPTVEKFNQMIAPLEGKETAISFASGSGAIAASLLSILKAGDHVLYNQRCYSWARHLFKNHLLRFGIECTEVPDADFVNIKSYVKPNTKMIYVETPTYYFFQDLDLTNLFLVAKQKNILTVIDNTYHGPSNLKPEVNQFDMVLHSTTKMICGDGTAMGGVICTTHALRKKIFTDGLMSLGSVMTPATARKMINGLSTYNDRAQMIALEMKPLIKFLKSEPRIKRFFYPWQLKDINEWQNHPHAKFPVGLFSIELATESPQIIKTFCESVKVLKMGVSYGSNEALLMPSLIFAAKGSDLHFPAGMCRISIGQQKGLDVANDIKQALDIAFA
jgi:cystathionine beta-lyase/cystathionine gamma-synthase